MPEYLTPGVYPESVPSSSNVIEQVSSTVGAIIGKFKSGPVNKATLITSYDNFINTFGIGVSNIFDKSSYAPYSVLGFFQNGGKKLYVSRIANGATKAKQSIESFYDYEATAIQEGEGPVELSFSNASFGLEDEDMRTGVLTFETPFTVDLNGAKNKKVLQIKEPGIVVTYNRDGVNLSGDENSNTFEISIDGTPCFNYTFKDGDYDYKFAVELNYNTRKVTMDIKSYSTDTSGHKLLAETAKFQSNDFGEAKFKSVKVTSINVGSTSTAVFRTNLGFESRYEGSYMNGYKASVTIPYTGRYAYELVSQTGEVVESFSAFSTEDLLKAINDNSAYVVCTDLLGIGTVVLNGGSDGSPYSALSSTVLGESFDDVASEVALICSPDYTTEKDINTLIEYANSKNIFAITQGEGDEDVSEIKKLRSVITSGNGALYYPYINVADPVDGSVVTVPPCGHIMGNFAKVITNRGVWKNPAGVEYPLAGVVSTADISNTQKSLTSGDTDILNPLNVNCIMLRPSYGICVWGCRTLHTDSKLRYVADILLKQNLTKSLYAGTQNLVFEPIDSYLYTKATTSVQSFLDTLWREGAFYGDTSASAYYVKCNEDNNPENSRNLGRLIIECGYAQKKPGEFVIIKIAHEMPSATN